MTKILIVEDDPDSRFFMEQILGEKGHQVTSAEHGEEALKLARQDPPEVIISDIMMPVMNGFLFCHEAKQDPLLKDIPFIFYTAVFVDGHDEKLAQSLGADRFAIKPMEAPQLFRLIEDVLEEHRQGKRPLPKPPREDEEALLAMYETSITHKLEETVGKLRKERRILQESERRLKEAQEIAQIGDWYLDLRTSELNWSDEIYRIFGLKPHAFDATYEAFLDAIHPDDRAVVNKAYQDSLTKKTSYAIDHRLLLKDGTVKYVHERCQTIFDDDGQPLYSLGTVQDVTQRKQMEEALKKANEELEEKVKKRTEELARANEQLKELDRLKSMLIASMSHELRTPLNSIIGFTHILLQGLAGELTTQQKEPLERVHKAGEHLLSLVSDVIDISKIEAGRVEVSPAKCSIGEVIEEAIETIRLQIENKGLRLQVDVPTDIPLFTDRRRLLQCMLNLLTNAVKFSEQGDITVIVRELEEDIEIAVSDSGIGITEEDLPKVFEAFERIESHLKVKAGGAGLGLYLTRKIATDLLGGSVSVESQAGEGSTFRIRIPRALNT